MSGKNKKLPVFKHKRPTKGFLIIGDPHLWSKKPGRRLDTSYNSTILGKISYAIDYANENDLWPVCTGDLMHEAQDSNLEMIEDILHTLEQSDRKMIVLVGNHDISETTLKKGTTLNLLNRTGCIMVMMENAPFGVFEMIDSEGEEKRVLLGGTPYGYEIPSSLGKWSKGKNTQNHNEMKKSFKVDKSVWITHDDLAFDSHYPGAKQLHEITGVDMAINGHMHKEQKPLQKGNTSWYNPGNISRITIDLIEQKPKVWIVGVGVEQNAVGGDGLNVIEMKSVEISHIEGREILSMEGKISINEKKDPTTIDEKASSFVEKIKKDEMIGRTDDAVFLKEAIEHDFEENEVPEVIREIVMRLLDKSTKEKN